jgi:hypothetical protein
MSLKNSMTKRSTRHNKQVGKLKALILTGSVIATLAGTRLLALQEPAKAEVPFSTTESITVVVPAVSSSSVPLPPTDRGTRVELKAIPQVVQPQLNPVARTQSSQ